MHLVHDEAADVGDGPAERAAPVEGLELLRGRDPQVGLFERLGLEVVFAGERDDADAKLFPASLEVRELVGQGLLRASQGEDDGVVVNEDVAA